MGSATNCYGKHITQQEPTTMESVIKMALAYANLEPNKIGYISAQGKATAHGDQSESIATNNIFAKNTPIS